MGGSGDGFFYNRARYYSPTTGRFVSSDPIGLQGGINTYGYAGGNPVRFIDPQGLATLQAGLSISAQFGPFTVQFGGGFAIDTQGNIGTYTYTGLGGGSGNGASGGFSLQASDAQTIYDLNGLGIPEQRDH
ncbi:MAG: RHS repeat-associated core domain-containing protein [Acidiferrobacterales bacterium]